MLEEKMRRWLWILRHLRRSGVDAADLLFVYKSILRPVLDFAAPTYHAMLNKVLSNRLEALQRRAMKIIYGTERSYDDIIEKCNIERLDNRREEIFVRFAKKAAASANFGTKWFPKKLPTAHNTRFPDYYIEERARTTRMKKNPISYMRQELNKQNRSAL